MGALFSALFGWMPFLLQVICTGIVAIFFIVSALHVIAFILDLLPFV